jgi:hypothetical protein
MHESTPKDAKLNFSEHVQVYCRACKTEWEPGTAVPSNPGCCYRPKLYIRPALGKKQEG